MKQIPFLCLKCAAKFTCILLYDKSIVKFYVSLFILIKSDLYFCESGLLRNLCICVSIKVAE